MQSKKSVRQLLAAMLSAIGVTIAVTGFVIVATESPALAAYENCTGTKICTYWDTNGGGAMYYYTGPAHTCIGIGGSWNDQISSVKNRLSTMVTFYSESGCHGLKEWVGAYCNCPSDHLNTITWPLNDEFSSLWIGTDHPQQKVCMKPVGIRHQVVALGSHEYRGFKSRHTPVIKRTFNTLFPYYRLCLHRWCFRGQTYDHMCQKHQDFLYDNFDNETENGWGTTDISHNDHMI